MNRQEALHLAIPEVNIYGFSDSLVQKMQLNYRDFPFTNINDLTNYFLQSELSKFSEKLAQIDFKSSSISQNINSSISCKIDQSDLTILKSLQNYFIKNLALISLNKHIFKLSDLIWNRCGDNSLDFNYYSKRIILSKIILLSFLHLSRYEDKDKSKKFAEYLINKSKNLGRFKKLIKELV